MSSTHRCSASQEPSVSGAPALESKRSPNKLSDFLLAHIFSFSETEDLLERYSLVNRRWCALSHIVSQPAIDHFFEKTPREALIVAAKTKNFENVKIFLDRYPDLSVKELGDVLSTVSEIDLKMVRKLVQHFQETKSKDVVMDILGFALLNIVEHRSFHYFAKVNVNNLLRLLLEYPLKTSTINAALGKAVFAKNERFTEILCEREEITLEEVQTSIFIATTLPCMPMEIVRILCQKGTALLAQQHA